MIVRTRLRAFVYPLLLYVLSGSIAGYFVWTAVNGQRGLKTRLEYHEKIAALETELGGLRAERHGWERRIALMRADAVDSDLLDEEARAVLGRVSSHDLVVFLNNRATNSPAPPSNTSAR
ncbi:MAG TPA: septum formation initiator family protein [Beijerinckiaceae bacterium]|jgi:cell division protein FtsB|nr:septum formation initiator family protein [Beijerinckiaceae bacterium]